MKITDRIDEYLKLKNISKNAFDQSIDASNGYIGKQISKGASIGSDVIQNIISTYKDINPAWLLTGEGTMLRAGVGEQPKGPILAPAGVGIPLIPIDALAGVGMGELVITEHDIEQRYVVPEFEKAEFLIRVKGSSMYPKYNAGDLLACRRVAKTDFIQWNKTYVLDTTQGILVKRILKGTHNNHWILRSDNKDYLDIDVEPEQHVHGISLVIGVIRLE
jgi:phage repressor protein C with HTH and peptisase S24 domain